MYDYYEAVKEDVLTYIKENDLDLETYGRHELENRLYDDLMITDSVTGNASGSYTFSRVQAQEYVEDNKDLVREMCYEYDNEATVADWWFNDDYESIDVCLRCYVLGVAISNALDELEEAAE